MRCLLRAKKYTSQRTHNGIVIFDTTKEENKHLYETLLCFVSTDVNKRDLVSLSL